jgi:hypothetical protein
LSLLPVSTGKRHIALPAFTVMPPPRRCIDVVPVSKLHKLWCHLGPHIALGLRSPWREGTRSASIFIVHILYPHATNLYGITCPISMPPNPKYQTRLVSAARILLLVIKFGNKRCSNGKIFHHGITS